MESEKLWTKKDNAMHSEIGDYSQDVDFEELNREMEMSGEKKK